MDKLSVSERTCEVKDSTSIYLHFCIFKPHSP